MTDDIRATRVGDMIQIDLPFACGMRFTCEQALTILREITQAVDEKAVLADFVKESVEVGREAARRHNSQGDLLWTGKIDAIKHLRERSGLGLADAKKAIEAAGYDTVCAALPQTRVPDAMESYYERLWRDECAAGEVVRRERREALRSLMQAQHALRSLPERAEGMALREVAEAARALDDVLDNSPKIKAWVYTDRKAAFRAALAKVPR